MFFYLFNLFFKVVFLHERILNDKILNIIYLLILKVKLFKKYYLN